ncbi:MAG: hypothetical protein ABI193_11235 [Minicystis sp.]
MLTMEDVKSALTIKDPGLADVIEVKRHETPEPSGGANRLRIHVPTDNAELLMGSAAKEGDDVGLRASATTHIHLVTTAAPATVVSLGGPAQSITSNGALGEPAGTSGYAMVTDGAAYHDADGEHYVISRNASLNVATKVNVNVKATTGSFISVAAEDHRFNSRHGLFEHERSFTVASDTAGFATRTSFEVQVNEAATLFMGNTAAIFALPERFEVTVGGCTLSMDQTTITLSTGNASITLVGGKVLIHGDESITSDCGGLHHIEGGTVELKGGQSITGKAPTISWNP